MNETQLTVVGNATADVELMFLPSGKACAEFTVASTPRRFDSKSQEWRDEDSLFQRCKAYGPLAENLAETVTRGMRVIVMGRLRQRNFTTKDGDKRSVVELILDDGGPSVKNATAKVNKADRGQGGGFSGGSGGGGSWGQSGGRRQEGRSDDPWGGQPANVGASGGGYQDDEPPF